MTDDDSKTAKDLWEESKRIYTTTNAHDIINLERELKSLRFEDIWGWEKHLENIHNILGKLAAYESPVKT